MLTPFGKEFRKVRIDHDMKLGLMAEKLGISPAFLTSIETGRKSVPDDMVGRIADLLHLTFDEVQKLERAAETSKTTYKIPVPFGTTSSGREAAALFAKKFESLTAAQLQEILSILVKEGDQHE